MAQHYYYITWFPRPDFLQDTSLPDQFAITWPIISQLAKHFSDWGLSPEKSSAGYIHYHGFFQLKPKQSTFKATLALVQAKGFIKINRVKRCLDTTYMRKDNVDMQQLLNMELPIFTEVPIYYSDPDDPINLKIED